MIMISKSKSLSYHLFSNFNTMHFIQTGIVNYKAKNKGFIF